jgi:Domain of Unknown Function (DUF928)
MRYVTMAAWGALAGLIFMIPLPSVALDDQKGKPSRPVVGPQSQRSAAAANIPVYVPPPRSAPGGRVGGSTRGTGMMPILSALAPDHTGLTTQEQPSLFWYLAGATTYPVELTIIDDQTIQPLLERRLSGPIQPGVQRVRLADYGVRFSPGVPYRWSVALVVDPDSRSRDNIAGGTIERIALPKALRAKLDGAGKTNAPSIYAEAGLWYDALTAISDLINAAPHDPALQQQRASLLEQVGLRDIAEHDQRRRHPQ